MFVLSRITGEAIVIGPIVEGIKDLVRITVRTIDAVSRSVRLAIEAPPDWQIPSEVTHQSDGFLDLGPVENRPVTVFFAGVLAGISMKAYFLIVAPKRCPVYHLEAWEAIYGQRAKETPVVTVSPLPPTPVHPTANDLALYSQYMIGESTCLHIEREHIQRHLYVCGECRKRLRAALFLPAVPS